MGRLGVNATPLPTEAEHSRQKTTQGGPYTHRLVVLPRSLEASGPPEVDPGSSGGIWQAQMQISCEHLEPT